MRGGTFSVLAVLSSLVWATPAAGQGSIPDLVRSVAGCWASEVGEFAPPLSLDRLEWAGLPVLLQVDTVPGQGRDGAPLGWLVRTITPSPRQFRTNGYLLPGGADTLQLHWTNFFSVGIAVTVVVRGDSMTGVADAWTDAVTSNKAAVRLFRVVCP